MSYGIWVNTLLHCVFCLINKRDKPNNIYIAARNHPVGARLAASRSFKGCQRTINPQVQCVPTTGQCLFEQAASTLETTHQMMMVFSHTQLGVYVCLKTQLMA